MTDTVTTNKASPAVGVGSSNKPEGDVLVRGIYLSPTTAVHLAVDHVHHMMVDVPFAPSNAAPKPQAIGDAALNAISAAFPSLLPVTSSSSSKGMAPVDAGPFVAFMSSQEGSFAAVRVLPTGLVTLDISLALAAGKQPPASSIIESVRDKVVAFVEAAASPVDERSSAKSDAISEPLAVTADAADTIDVDPATSTLAPKCFPPVIRGGAFDPYLPSTDGLLIQYDFVELLYHRKSLFQDIKIFKSLQFGGVLVLDNDVNLAESDRTYTETIIAADKIDYTGLDVLVLGAGDGGILNVLLEDCPQIKHVTMVEIDQLVIDGAVKHLRGICGSALDKLEGDKYNVIVDDCIPLLKKWHAEGRKFDVIINDLTAIPVTASMQGGDWDFLKLILELSMKVLREDGWYTTQGNGFNNQSALQMYESLLDELPLTINMSKETVTVPSYQEQWVFYALRVSQQQAGSNL